MSTRTVGVSAVLVTAVLWGTTGAAATFAPEAGPLAIGAAALGVGGILQAAIAVPAMRGAGGLLRANPRLIGVGALAVLVYPLAFYSSMYLAGVAIGTVVSLASAPLVSGLLELVVEQVALSRRWVLAAVLGTAGSALLCLGRVGESAEAGWETAVGVVLGLAAGSSYALYSWAVHALMERQVPRSAAMGAVFGAGGILLLPVLVLTGSPLLDTTRAFTVAAYMALVPMFLGYFLFGIGLARLRPSTVTAITLVEPAVAALLAVVVVGERLVPLGWFGLALLVVSLGLLVLAPASVPAPVQPPGISGGQRRIEDLRATPANTPASPESRA